MRRRRRKRRRRKRRQSPALVQLLVGAERPAVSPVTLPMMMMTGASSPLLAEAGPGT